VTVEVKLPKRRESGGDEDAETPVEPSAYAKASGKDLGTRGIERAEAVAGLMMFREHPESSKA